jgi:hypothetical protein
MYEKLSLNCSTVWLSQYFEIFKCYPAIQCTIHKKCHYKASHINYAALKLSFAELLPLYYAVFTCRKCYVINGWCLIAKFFMNGALDS